MSKAKDIILLIDEIVQDRDNLKEVIPTLSDKITPSGDTIKGALYKISKDRKFIDSLKQNPQDAKRSLTVRFKAASGMRDSCDPCIDKFLGAIGIKIDG